MIQRPAVIIMHKKLSSFTSERKIRFFSSYKRIGTARTEAVGDIGRKINVLLKKHDKTLHEISENLTDIIGMPVSAATLYSWVKGSTPRKIHPDLVDKSLDLLVKNSSHKFSTWVNPEEVKEIIEFLANKFSLTEISQATGVPISSLGSWKKGLYRVKRARFEKFIKAVNTKLNETIELSLH